MSFEAAYHHFCDLNIRVAPFLKTVLYSPGYVWWHCWVQPLACRVAACRPHAVPCEDSGFTFCKVRAAGYPRSWKDACYVCWAFEVQKAAFSRPMLCSQYVQPLCAQVVARSQHRRCPDLTHSCALPGVGLQAYTPSPSWAGGQLILPLGTGPAALPAAPRRLQQLSLCWLPQHTEVKQIELLFKLAGYRFDRCPFEMCVWTGKMHATFQPPPAARRAVMPLANAYSHWALLSWKAVAEACPVSRMISASPGLSLTDVNS